MVSEPHREPLADPATAPNERHTDRWASAVLRATGRGSDQPELSFGTSDGDQRNVLAKAARAVAFFGAGGIK